MKFFLKTVVVSIFFISQIEAQNFTWVNKYGSASSGDEAKAITTDAAGNIYTTGYFTSTTTFGSFTLTSAGGTDIYVSKFNSSGTVLWAKKLGGTGYDEGNSISVDVNGNVFITAIYEITSGGQKSYCAKFDSNGNYIVARQYGGVYSNNSTAVSGALDSQGNYIIVGNYNGENLFDGSVANNSGNSGFAIKYDNTLNFTWSFSLGAVSPNSNNVRINTVAFDAYDNPIFGGFAYGNGANIDYDPNTTTNLTSANQNLFILKLDANKNLKWASLIQVFSNQSEIYKIKVGNSGDLYLGGKFLATQDFDSGTNVSNLTSTGTSDIFVLKLDSLGFYKWSKKIGGTGLEIFGELALDNSDNVFMTGDFGGTVDFNPGTGINNLTSTSSTDVFISKLNYNGDYVSSYKFGGSGANSYGNGIAVDVNGNVYSTGFFSGTMDFDPTSAVYNLTGSADMFLVKLSGCAHNAPNICLVTVDSLALNNVIYWDKAVYPSADTFIIFRYDAFSTNYLRIGAKSFNQPNFLIDTARTTGGPNGGNPQYSSYRYKLAIKDLCGTMGTKGLYHESIFIQQNNQNFSWNAYGIEGQASPATGYQFMRDNINNGTWQVLVNTGGLSTTDPNYLSYPNGNWRVDALGFSCNPTAKLNGTSAVVNRSKSNIKNNFVITSASQLELNANISLSPNPAKSELLVHFSNNQQIKTEFVITDVLGKVVYKSETLENEKVVIPLNDISSGVYFLKIKQGKLHVVKKFVKE